MSSSEYIPKHAKLDEYGEPLVSETSDDYQPKHAKANNPWQEMADSAPEFASDSDRQKQIVEKWDQRLEAAKPGIAYNEKAYDELVDELLYNRDAIKYEDVSDEDKTLLAERKTNAEGMLEILERGALNYREDESGASTEELTDGSVILKKDREAYDTYRETINATQSAYDEFYGNCPRVFDDLTYDEWTLITEGEVRGSYRNAPEPYQGIWDEWMGMRAGDLDRGAAERARKELKTFLFEDKDRHVHLKNRAKLVTLYNELNEYLYGEKEEA